MRKLVLTGCLAGVCFLTGCAARSPRAALNTAKAPASTPVPRSGTYVDLQPQWRLRVVTPILKSGGYVLGALGAETDGKTVMVDTGGDFLGYEIAYHAVHPRRGGGVRIDFTAAEATRNGVTAPQAKSIAPLFDLPRDARYVRLIYLIRASQVDHDMAVVAARDMVRLNVLTLRIQAGPASACVDGRDGSCSWVPQGIAVRPEVERTAGGVAT